MPLQFICQRCESHKRRHSRRVHKSVEPVDWSSSRTSPGVTQFITVAAALSVRWVFFLAASLVLMTKPSFSCSAQTIQLKEEEEEEEGLFGRGRGQEMTLSHRELVRVREGVH